MILLVLFHSDAQNSEQLYRLNTFQKMESAVDAYMAYHVFPFDIENNVETIRDIALLIFS